MKKLFPCWFTRPRDNIPQYFRRRIGYWHVYPFQRAACALLYNATKTGCVLPARRTGRGLFLSISVQSFSEEKRNSEGFCPAYV